MAMLELNRLEAAMCTIGEDHVLLFNGIRVFPTTNLEHGRVYQPIQTSDNYNMYLLVAYDVYDTLIRGIRGEV